MNANEAMTAIEEVLGDTYDTARQYISFGFRGGNAPADLLVVDRGTSHVKALITFFEQISPPILEEVGPLAKMHSHIPVFVVGEKDAYQGADLLATRGLPVFLKKESTWNDIARMVQAKLDEAV